MFCEKCGASLTPNDAFCRNCGAPHSAQPAAPVAPAAPEVPATPAASAAPAAPKRTGLIVALCCAIVVLLAVIVTCLVLLFGGKGSRTLEGTVDKFVSSVSHLDAAGLADLIPEEMFAYANTTRSEFIDSTNNALGEARAYMSALNLDISHEITDQTPLSAGSFRALQDTYADYGLTISDAQKVRVRLEMSAGALGSQSTSRSIYLVQIDDNWYLDVVNSDIDMG